jgi:hypothetical protein
MFWTVFWAVVAAAAAIYLGPIVLAYLLIALSFLILLVKETLAALWNITLGGLLETAGFGYWKESIPYVITTIMLTGVVVLLVSWIF